MYRDKFNKLATRYSKKFSIETIKDLWPDYYSRVKPELETINERIATARESKDVTKTPNKIIGEIENYKEILNQLSRYYNKALKLEPLLSGHQREVNKRGFYSNLCTFIIAVLGMLAVHFILKLF